MSTMGLVSELTGRSGGGQLRRGLAQQLTVLASLALVMLAAVSALVMVQGIDGQIRDVLHTYEVRNQARELTIALSEAESSQRGYLLTGDQSYLASYRRSVSAIETGLVSLTAVTGSDPQQARKVQAIANEIIVKSAEMERTVALVEEDRNAEARRLIRTGMGERVMDSLRTALEEFISEENQKLFDRNQAIDWSRRWLVGAIMAALAGAVVLAYALVTRTQRQVTALARSKDQLVIENEVLEAHVLDRTRALEEARAHAEHERQRVEALLRDASHRIGNSLATVSSLLGLQLMRSKSGEVQAALEAARLRVHAIASAHRRLRLGEDCETASADEFLEAVLEDLAATASDRANVRMVGQFEPIVVNARDATTLGILVGELVTNAVKHAFPEGRGGVIEVSLARDEAGTPLLTVQDDGIGLASDSGESGLGQVIIRQLAGQFGGAALYESRVSGGLSVRVTLPDLEGATAPGSG